MAKVLLVQSAHIYQHHTHLHPLGIMYIASSLLAAGHEARILDMKVEGLTVDDAVREVARVRPDVLGITAMTYESVCMNDLARRVRAEMPEVRIVVGGAHPANEPEETLTGNPAIDCVCIGEGEITLPDLLDAWREGRALTDVPGLAFRENGAVVRSPARPYIQDLDSMPPPAWDLVPVKKYFTMERGGIIFHHREFMTVMTSRGCPYRCAYCHRNLGKTWRPRRPEKVVEEMETLVRQYGIREIEIMDDMFNLDRKRVQEICRLIREKKLDISMTFPNGLRADLMDEETLTALKDAGMYRTMFAIETASPRIQKLIKKHVKLDKARRIVETAANMGIMTHGAFMLGFPTETEEEMRMTIDFALTSKFHTAAFYRVLPFRGSALYDMVRAERPHINLDPTHLEYHSTDVNLSEVEEDQVTRLRKRAYRRFYLNPVRLARILYRLPNKRILVPHLTKIFFLRAMER